MNFKTLSAPLFVCWDITYRCNLKCTHCCFETDKADKTREFSTEEGKALFDSLAALKVISFQFAGGEPFCRNDILELTHYVASKGIVTTFASNGTLITFDIAKELKKVGVRGVQLSIDGSNAEIHEAIRGKNSFDRVIDAVENLKRNDIPISVATVLSKNNYDDVIKLIDYLHQLGLKSLRLQFLLLQARGKENKDLLYVERDQIKAKIEELQKYPLIKTGQFKLILPCFIPKIISRDFRLSKSKFLSSLNCGAGTSQLNIDPYGNVTACGILTDKEWICGNLRDQTLEEIWTKSSKLEPWRMQITPKGKCGSCSHLESCKGGCRANAILSTGDFFAEDPLCWLEE